MSKTRDPRLSKGDPAPVRLLCSVCERPMYHVPAIYGEGSEWRHDSSGHAVSWSPDRHNAGPVRVRVHNHRWSAAVDGVMRCEVEGCDSTTLPKPQAPVEAEDPQTAAEARKSKSRQRGGAVTGAVRKKG